MLVGKDSAYVSTSALWILNGVDIGRGNYWTTSDYIHCNVSIIELMFDINWINFWPGWCHCWHHWRKQNENLKSEKFWLWTWCWSRLDLDMQQQRHQEWVLHKIRERSCETEYEECCLSLKIPVQINSWEIIKLP